MLLMEMGQPQHSALKHVALEHSRDCHLQDIFFFFLLILVTFSIGIVIPI